LSREVGKDGAAGSRRLDKGFKIMSKKLPLVGLSLILMVTSVAGSDPEKFELRSQADIEQAFSNSGLNLCGQLTLGIPNRGYKFDKSTHYHLLEGACPPTLRRIYSVPGLVAVSVETFKDSTLQNQGIAVHRDEVIDGTSFPRGRGHVSSIAWRYGQFLIVVGHTTPPSAIHRLAPSMAKMGAQLAFDNRTKDGGGEQPKTTSQKKGLTPEDRAVKFCRSESLLRLMHVRTVEWLDSAREEKPGVWLISGVRTARGPNGDVDQGYTCRVVATDAALQLKLIQIFKDASKTGKDIFEVR
jgi:hypothetical protein